MKKGDFKPTEGADGSTQEKRKPMEGASGSPRENGRPNDARSSSSGILGVIASNLGVISVFSILTFYAEKLFTKRKKVVVKALKLSDNESPLLLFSQ